VLPLAQRAPFGQFYNAKDGVLPTRLLYRFVPSILAVPSKYRQISDGLTAVCTRLRKLPKSGRLSKIAGFSLVFLGSTKSLPKPDVEGSIPFARSQTIDPQDSITGGVSAHCGDPPGVVSGISGAPSAVHFHQAKSQRFRFRVAPIVTALSTTVLIPLRLCAFA
jgi:hypothetical protein